MSLAARPIARIAVRMRANIMRGGHRANAGEVGPFAPSYETDDGIEY